MEVVGERNRTSSSVRCQSSCQVAVQGIVAVLGLLVRASGKRQAATTSVEGHYAALDSQGASSLLGGVAKGAAPEEHFHVGAGEVVELLLPHGMGGMEFQPQGSETAQNCGAESGNSHAACVVIKSLQQMVGRSSPFAESYEGICPLAKKHLVAGISSVEHAGFTAQEQALQNGTGLSTDGANTHGKGI